MDSLQADLPPQYERLTPLTHQLEHSASSPQSAQPGRLRFLPGDEEDEECPVFPDDTDAPLPPAYTAFDETINSFILEAPLIHTVDNNSSRPRYQLSQEFSRSGKLYRLRIRRLLPTESRRLSVPATSKARSVEFDDDTTLYAITNLRGLSIFKSQNIEIRGRRANTLPGHISLRDVDGKWEFSHVTRNPAGDALKKQNERKMQKYGYRPTDEWNTKGLFLAVARSSDGKIDWQDEKGQVVAVEAPGRFDITKEVDQRTRDTLVTCWIARRWSGGNFPWTKQDSDLARAVSLGF
jgi:hypothetical protein